MLRPVLRHKLTLFIIQRLSSARQADRILVLAKGEVAGLGTHAELLLNSEAYRRIARTQLAADELAKELECARQQLTSEQHEKRN